VLTEACRQATAWDLEASKPLRMSVNVSGRQILHPGFPNEVGETLAATGFEPARLTLELTESVLMQDVDVTGAALAALKQLGVRLAIDDFGTGYSSLSYLRRFPIDELKIDRSFVATVNVGPDQSALVRSILKLGDTLHLETVAEGIEEAAQLAELKGLGADLGQGFFFARPLEPDAISALLAAGESPMEGTDVQRDAA
jgi:EAL domain-containing protein (putative c-di-GMP-specific phosphodiesterase class I)